jgi:trk system potassium uptake protein TrkA
MKRIAVIGLGRFGTKLAMALSMSGAEVIAIDRDRESVEDIRDQVAHAVRMDSTEIEALRSQGVDKADAAVIGMAQGGSAFEAAVMTIVNLKELGVPKIYARAASVTMGRVLTAVGATEVIYPENETAQRWAYKLIAPHITDKIAFAPGYSLASVKAPASFDGRTIMELQLRQKYNVNLVAIQRAEPKKFGESHDTITVPAPDTVIYSADVLMIAGSDDDIARLPQE